MCYFKALNKKHDHATLSELMINVNITRNANENPLSVIRRFTRKVQSSGVIPRVRSLRFSDRVQSHYKVKQKALKKIGRRTEMAELIKLGKAPSKITRK
jgi:ribosomal protein S21